MSIARLPISLVAATLLAASAAQAADLPLPPPVIESIGGWYLRGDIGFSNQQLGSLFSTQYSAFSSVQNVDRGFDAAPLFGLGIGYNFNDWLRFDVTGEYRGSANFHGLDIGTYPPAACTSGPAPCYATDRYTARKYEWTFLLNGYVDLGTWYNVTPFVGAGIGVTRNTITNFGDFSTCVNTTSCSASGGSDAYAGTASKTNFAWALHAGLAYRVTRNFTVELAYRYIDLGNAITGNAITSVGTVFPPFEFHHLTSHDVRLGLRFDLNAFGDCCRPAPIYAPPPPLHSRG